MPGLADPNIRASDDPLNPLDGEVDMGDGADMFAVSAVLVPVATGGGAPNGSDKVGVPGGGPCPGGGWEGTVPTFTSGDMDAIGGGGRAGGAPGVPKTGGMGAFWLLGPPGGAPNGMVELMPELPSPPAGPGGGAPNIGSAAIADLGVQSEAGEAVNCVLSLLTGRNSAGKQDVKCLTAQLR